MAGERTEQATQHRREKARKEGDILHSRELAAAAGTLAGVMLLGLSARDRWRPGARRSREFLALGSADALGAGNCGADARHDKGIDAGSAGSRRQW